MNRKGFRGLVLGTVIAYSLVIGVFLIYTTLFAIFNGPVGLGDSWVAFRLISGTGFIAMGLAFGILLDMARELELIV